MLTCLAACGDAGGEVEGVVQVAAPTGDRERDLASLRAALDSVAPGGTVAFAPGTYRIGGEGTEVATSDVTLLGNPEGTVLQGCGAEEVADMDVEAFFGRCAGLALTGGRQVVRDLTFEGFGTALFIAGPLAGGLPQPNREGGHLIEGNTIRNSITSEVHSDAELPIVFRGNTFRNVYHALAALGRNVHALENDISVPEPERVPFGWPSLAFGLRPAPGVACTGNRFEGNTIEGHTDGVVIGVLPPDGPGASCVGTTVRSNVIRLVPVLHTADAGPPLAGTPAIGVAIRLLNMQAAIPSLGDASPFPTPPGGWPAEFAQASITGTVIEDNQIEGAIGVAIEVYFGSGNRVANNRVGVVTPMSEADRERVVASRAFGVGAGQWIRARDWASVNGTAIWVSPGSEGNEVVDNVLAGGR